MRMFLTLISVASFGIMFFADIDMTSRYYFGAFCLIFASVSMFYYEIQSLEYK